MKKVTLLVKLLCILYLTSFALNAQVNNPSVSKQGFNEGIKQYQVADFDEPESTDQQEREKRRGISKRFDNKDTLFISKNPPKPYYTGLTAVRHCSPPSILPASDSKLILIGEVVNAGAYVSNDKRAVYSEFTIRIENLLKNNNSEKVKPRELVTMDRIGGYVRYPNGQKLLYLFSGYEYPQVGRRYLLFLNNPDESPNYNILSGYELKNGQVKETLDSCQGSNFLGLKELDFIKKVKEGIMQ